MTEKTFRVPCIIDRPLWTRAGFVAVAFATPEREPPVLGLVFRDTAAAIQIFDGWIRQLGQLDPHELLRVAIIEGPVPGLVAGYSAHIGLDFDALGDAVTATCSTSLDVDEFQPAHGLRMPDSSTSQLARFKRSYYREGHYYLMPATNTGELHFLSQAVIRKRRIYFRSTIELMQTDPDGAVLLGK